MLVDHNRDYLTARGLSITQELRQQNNYPPTYGLRPTQGLPVSLMDYPSIQGLPVNTWIIR